MFSLQFSPTGQQWAAATTEGLLIYSLNTNLVFDPWDLQLGITPASVRDALNEEDFSNGLFFLTTLFSPTKFRFCSPHDVHEAKRTQANPRGHRKNPIKRR